MTRSDRVTDQLLEAAFARQATRPVPADLRDQIVAQTAIAAQRGTWRLRLEGLLTVRSSRARWTLILVAATILGGALLVAAAGRHTPTPLHPGAWTLAARMPERRDGATATLLGDGTVLVAGGTSGSPPQVGTPPILASSELYVPSASAAGTWRATGSMIESRSHHTATRLNDGTVLVAGGDNANGTLDSAEIYDPVNGSWASVGQMHEARVGFIATLLPNGMVLAVGGSNETATGAFQPLASAELYDPTSRSWTATGSMLERRVQFTATLLPSGNVLVAGGGGGAFGTDALSSAELYDPARGTWTETAPMSSARDAAAATLLPDGRVLVVGGYPGGGFHGGAVPTAELYDQRTGSWVATGSMNDRDAALSITLLHDGSVLVTAGFEDDVSAPRHHAELYDPSAGSWTATATKLAASTGATATLLLDGRVLIAGGSYIGDPLDAAQLFDPSGGS